jgi:hypothetical protein
VAFVAVTVSVDEVPEMIEAGLAAMLIVGVAAGSPGRSLDLAAPHPTSVRSSGNTNIAANSEEILQSHRWGRIFIVVVCSLENRVESNRAQSRD